MPRKSSVIEVVVKKKGRQVDMYPKERLIVVKTAIMKNELEGARRYCDANVRLCIRGSRWLLKVDHVRIKNPGKYILFFFLTLKKQFDADEMPLHTIRVDVVHPDSRDGSFNKLDIQDLHDGIELPVLDYKDWDPNDFQCVVVGKPSEFKPPTPLTIMYSEQRLEPVEMKWRGDRTIEHHISKLRHWMKDLRKKVRSKKKSKIHGMDYYRLKDPAKLMFEMLGKNRFESIEFEDFKRLMRSMDINFSEALMHTMFRFSDPENDGLIDTLELQFLLYLSTKMPKNDDVTLEDCFFMEDDRDGNHVKRIDMQSGYHIARLFDDQIDEVKFRQAWYDQDISRPRLHTLDYKNFRDVFIKTSNVVKMLQRYDIEVVFKGGAKKVKRENFDNLERYIVEGDVDREAAIAKAYKRAIKARRANRLALDTKRWEKKKVEKEERRLRRLRQAEEYREMLEERRRKEEEDKERRRVERKLTKRNKKQLEKRETAKKDRHREKQEWNKRIEDHRVRELELDRLNLSGQNLKDLPATLYKGLDAQRNLGRLVLVDLSHNRLRTIDGPRMVYWMGALQKLDCSHNHFTTLPTELASLSSILMMNFSANRFETLPPEVAQLKTLVKLDMSRNVLKSLPDEIGQMASLKALLLNHNDLQFLPDSIAACTSLTALKVQNNDLHRLPERIADLHNLRQLNGAENRLEYVPPALDGLTALRRLDLRANRIHDLPESCGTWTRLEQLDMSRNQLRVVPESMCKWVSCMGCDLARNQIGVLPKEIGRMTRLQDLDLQHNLIGGVPKSIGLMKELQVLNLSWNRIPCLPVEFGALQNLRRVDLSHNAIGSEGEWQLPPSFGTLFSLEWLNLAHNKLTDLCFPLSAAVQLSYLNVSHNQLTALPPYLSKLTTLHALHASNNLLPEYPADLCYMTHLRTLDISGNKLHDLPHEISELTGIRHFRANSNRLRALPLSFVKLFDGFISFDVSRNPLTDLPNKFCFEKGALKEHFGAHFIPKSKTDMVRQLLREEDERRAEVEKARARRASGVERAEITAAQRGRRRSSLALAFATPGSAEAAGLAPVQAPTVGPDGTLISRAAERWMKPEDELRYALTSLSLDPHPPMRAQISESPVVSHGFEAERKRELDEKDAAVWRMWRGDEPLPQAAKYWPEAETKGYSATAAVSWMKVQSVFYDAARAEWTATGWQHHSGKNTLVNFKEAVKNRMKDAWDEAIVPELQKFYFKSKHLGVLPEYEQLGPSRVQWREEQERLGNAMRTARVKRAKTAHSERLLRFRKNYKVDIPKTVRLGERNRLAKIQRDKESGTSNLKQLRSLVSTLDRRQQRIISENNRSKDYNYALQVWELQKYVMERSRYLNAKQQENYVPPPDPDLRLIDSDIAKAPYNMN